jgi:hypothetical protein
MKRVLVESTALLIHRVALVGSLLCLALVPGIGASATLSQAAVPAGREMTCAVVYMPERRTWPRRVSIRWQGDRLLGLQIDGLQPYSFSVDGTALATALDNERILLDLASMEWASDFRGLASGRGRCEWVN